jgi:hypothetical protein
MAGDGHQAKENHVTQLNVLREYLEPPPRPFPAKDVFLIVGVWVLVMGTAAALFFIR